MNYYRFLNTISRSRFTLLSLNVRKFATTSSSPYSIDAVRTSIKKYWPYAGYFTAAVVTVYGVSRLVYFVTSSLLTLDFEDVFEIGFFTGLGLSGAVAATSFYLSRYVLISPSRTLNAVRNYIKSKNISSLSTNSPLFAYNVSYGHLSMNTAGLKWVEPRCKLLFKTDDSFVTAEAVRHDGKIVLTLLVLDSTVSATSEPTIVIGNQLQLEVKGCLRGLLQEKKVNVIPQSKELTDSELVKEQEVLSTNAVELK
jgi:hypothetical protein